MPTTIPNESHRVGLCATCIHVHVITSSRDATFYLCRRSETDPTFPKYPTLPMLVCRGYEPSRAA